MEDQQNYRTAYHYRGIELQTQGKELRGDCPFCTATNKFYISQSKGTYHCKKCQASGNLSTFLEWLYSESFTATSSQDYKALSAERGIKAVILKEHGFAKSILTNNWLCPGYNSEGALANIYELVEEENEDGTKKRVFYGTATCKAHISGIENLDQLEEGGIVWICEGLWDRPAWYELLQRSKFQGGDVVLAVPGAGTFPEEEAKLLSGKDVVHLYDHDDPGRAGLLVAARRYNKLAVKPNSVRAMVWPEQFEVGSDIRDILKQFRKKPVDGYQMVLDCLESIEDTIELEGETLRPSQQSVKIDPIPCESFTELLELLRRVLYTTPTMEATFAVMLSVLISIWRGTRDPLWVYVIGPAGCGKSTLCELLSIGSRRVVAVSKMTSLVSGWRDKSGADASLIGRINHKCLIIKDYTTILTAPPGVKERLDGELRDSYDGRISVVFGNNVTVSYDDVRFSVIAGVTDAIRSHNNTNLGERFLCIEMVGDEHDDRQQSSAAMGAAMDDLLGYPSQENEQGTSGNSFREELQGKLLGYVEYLKEIVPETGAIPLSLYTHSEEYTQRIRSLAKIASLLRTQVKRDPGMTRDQDPNCRPRAEMPTRLASQLTRLGFFLCIVMQKQTMDDEVYRIIRQTAFDTVDRRSYRYEILRLLYEEPRDVANLSLYVHHLTNRTITRHLKDMAMLGMVRRAQQKRTGGRPTSTWQLTPELNKLWKEAVDGKSTFDEIVI